MKTINGPGLFLGQFAGGSAPLKAHVIRVTEHALDDFAGSGTDEAANRRMLEL
jgi:hypothetical protein